VLVGVEEAVGGTLALVDLNGRLAKDQVIQCRSGESDLKRISGLIDIGSGMNSSSKS
jgi:hypothetical protein